MEERTSLVTELSAMARQEKVALDQCRELLATAAKLQVLFELLSLCQVKAFASPWLVYHSHVIQFLTSLHLSSHLGLQI